MQRIVLLSSLLWWELGTNSLITGPGEWLSFRRFTSKLSWSLILITGKGKRTLGFLRRNFNDCSIPVKKTTYTAMVRPAMEYASTIWDLVSQKHIQMLEQIQWHAPWYVFNNYTDRTPGCLTQMVEDLNLESLEDHTRTNCLCMLYRILHNLVDVQPDTYLQVRDRQTRGHARFFQERTEFPGYRNSFFPHTTRDWNGPPSTATKASNLEGFRYLLPTATPGPKIKTFLFAVTRPTQKNCPYPELFIGFPEKDFFLFHILRFSFSIFPSEMLRMCSSK